MLASDPPEREAYDRHRGWAPARALPAKEKTFGELQRERFEREMERRRRGQ